MKILIIFIYLIITNFSYASEKPNIKNLVLIKNPKTYENIIFKDINQKNVNLDDFKGKLLILNFWATWCAPCKEEMPSLDNLKLNVKLNNLNIFPINVGKDNLKKSKKFFEDLNIKNLNIYFDNDVTLARDLSLRVVPTTILFNKEGKEFARIIGSIDFNDNNFINWISKYN